LRLQDETKTLEGEDLLRCKRTPLGIAVFLARACGDDCIERPTSGAHTRGWTCRFREDIYFVKWAERDHYEATLRKDVVIRERVRHPSIAKLCNVIEAEDGFALVFENARGTTLDAPNQERFFRLPTEAKLKALNSIFCALCLIAEDGWILIDFYEGNVIYNFIEESVKIFDFELFHRGDGFRLQQERNYGSSRLMAPEEFVKGSWIDQRTNAFDLGRYAICALSDRTGADWREGFEGDERMAEVLARATQPDPTERYPTVKAFTEAFLAATAGWRRED
jgi:serine/threonine-protein kinase